MQFFSFRRMWSLLPAPYMVSDVLTMLLVFMGFSSVLGDRPYSEGMMVERWLPENMLLYYRPLIIRIDGYQQLVEEVKLSPLIFLSQKNCHNDHGSNDILDLIV